MKKQAKTKYAEATEIIITSSSEVKSNVLPTNRAHHCYSKSMCAPHYLKKSGHREKHSKCLCSENSSNSLSHRSAQNQLRLLSPPTHKSSSISHNQKPLLHPSPPLIKIYHSKFSSSPSFFSLRLLKCTYIKNPTM